MWYLDLSKMENNFTAIRKWYKFICFITLKALTKIKKASKMLCLILAVGLVSSVSSYNVCFELSITITNWSLFELLIFCICAAAHWWMHSTCKWGPCHFFWKQNRNENQKNQFLCCSFNEKNRFEEFLDSSYFSGKSDCNEHMWNIELLNENRSHVKNNNEHVLFKYCHIGH